ncbi:MAG TPA: pyridoxal phosphate-dependent aminotransferase [bacterium]|jgi:aspartate aminotransferase
MLHPPATRTKKITPALTLETVARAAALKAEGKPVLSLSVGEPDFDTPPRIRVAGKFAIDHGITRYTEGRGTLALRKAISAKLARDQKLEYTPEQILCSNGGKHVITNFMLACINPGDEVILPAPYFLAYPELIKLADGIPVIIPTEPKDRYLMSPAQLEKAITPRTKMIVLITPSNPGSTAYSMEELMALAPVMLKSNAWILSDEVYEHLLYDGREQASPAHIPELYDRTLYVSSLSKTYAMTGWRLGYGCGPKDIVAAAAKLQSQMTSSPSAIAQHAAIEAVSNDQTDREEMRRVFEKRRDLLFSLIEKWPHVECPKPEGAFYVFPRIDGVWRAANKPYPGSLSVARQLLEEEYVATMAGAVFGDDRAIRLSFATSEEAIKEACGRIERFLNRV